MYYFWWLFEKEFPNSLLLPQCTQPAYLLLKKFIVIKKKFWILSGYSHGFRSIFLKTSKDKKKGLKKKR